MLLGIGIGMIIGTTLMTNAKKRVELSQYQIEMKAREYGMEYKDEYKVIERKNNQNTNNEDVKK
ncbi:hypothetical protein [Clostridium sp. ZS2-4]|uniref:hypothetical protein n=1 Tax=Clostridium sp. ZS2-4 TaxID=2987703 RepID=UPI00227A29DD|nr:hypothetical protein [Clostridium sp. ZS2-4]MCY6354023.1 hypothetical protein [Clostridium sp. ZS2-4]